LGIVASVDQENVTPQRGELTFRPQAANQRPRPEPGPLPGFSLYQSEATGTASAENESNLARCPDLISADQGIQLLCIESLRIS
jgi:hypothetical protein